jgi:alpha-tubulin suppressor-like RCC1 family protein
VVAVIRSVALLLLLAALSRDRGDEKRAYRSVTAGATHTCGIAVGGVAYCWGDNGYGQLGTGDERSSLKPVAVIGGESFSSLSAGDGFTCGVTTSGVGYCWGRSVYRRGESERQAHDDAPAAVVGGLLFSHISAGANHACGVTIDHTAYCWGANAQGQMGTGDTASSPTPLPVAGRLSFDSVSAGWDHTCGVTTNRVAYCWGNNRFGQLGDGTRDATRVPKEVGQVHDFVSVSAGGHHTCGVSARGTIYCWGDNFHSQLGRTGVQASRLGSWAAVALLAGYRFSAVTAGGFHTCALTLESIDRVTCWGANQDYQLGVRTSPESDRLIVSTDIFRGIAFVQIDAGDNHTCGRTDRGAIYCWGRNDDGELGDGTSRVPARPARVAEPDSTGN